MSGVASRFADEIQFDGMDDRESMKVSKLDHGGETTTPTESYALTNDGSGRLSAQAILSEGQRVLRQEAHALEAMAEKMDARFYLAVEMVAHCSGRVIATGVGKSGLIARKIASTMSSLGIRALFVHPTEAVHGDMGVLAPDDLILALSHSGNSEELLAFLEPVGTWLGLSVIALVGRAGGAIDNFSTVTLETGVSDEACALGLAPTTSSTATLALGDALAVCASKMKGVRPHDFARWHPSGSLGQRLYVRVKDLLHRHYASVDADALLDSVIRQISQGGLGVVLVDLGSAGRGIITDGDIRRAVQMHADWETKQAREIMSSPPCVIQEDALAFDALALMESKRITSLVVVDSEDQVTGIVHLHDILSSVSSRVRPNAT
jgi:arabinose-5-phosphate isomerase